MITIKQKKNASIEVDTREKDIVSIWYNEKDDANVVMVENANIQELINILQEELNKKS